MLLTSDGRALTGLYLEGHKRGPVPGESWRLEEAPFRPANAHLAAYFAGEVGGIDPPILLGGTEFQKSVWRALQAIRAGETVSYAALAGRIGAPNAVRAVGAAVGRNPISIVVPCHRVIGASGSLTGYAGGVARKRWLLDHERGGSDRSFGLISAPPGRGAAIRG